MIIKKYPYSPRAGFYLPKGGRRGKKKDGVRDKTHGDLLCPAIELRGVFKYDLPWSKHKIMLCLDNLQRASCVRLQRVFKGRRREYLLLFEDDKAKYFTARALIRQGYATKRRKLILLK